MSSVPFAPSEPGLQHASAAGNGQPSLGASMIKLEDVTLRFAARGQPDRLVIEGLNLAVKEGELLSIVGPSGCGKTSLLRVMAGLIRPTSGAVEIAGLPLAGPSPRVAMVFQEFALLPWRSVIQNVEFPLEGTGLSRQERRARARAALSEVQLNGREDAMPAALSGGMKQRVGLARALATDAEVLLMDEPFGAVDPQVRRLLQGSLLDLLKRTSKTIVFVTHDIDEAVLISDRICCLGSPPTGVREVIKIEIPRPRLSEQLETAYPNETAQYREHIWRMLSADIRAAYGVD